jgi:hypothetical protein
MNIAWVTVVLAKPTALINELTASIRRRCASTTWRLAACLF